MRKRLCNKNQLSQFAGICLTSIVLSACGGGAGGSSAVIDDRNNAQLGATSEDVCTVANINRWVDDRMRDTYIYYDQVPVVNLDEYTDQAALLRDLRVLPDIYSSIVDQARDEEIIANSSVTRFGFWLQSASDGKQHFASISGNSPMENAGIQRGDELVAINSVLMEDLTDDQWREFIVGEEGEELTAVFTVRSGTLAPADFSVTKSTYTESTVPYYGTYEQTNNSVGYLQVTAFRGTTEDEIDVAVESLAEAGISELILDLRYNGGGFTRVARKLASQIAGSSFEGEVYSRRIFNDKYSEFNQDFFIEPQSLNLNLSRLIVLATGDTASASETLANGLAPLINVVVIGARSEGKPFTSVSQDFCGLRLNAMSTITTNGADESVLGGMVPTCEVRDDYLAPTESPSDALTGAAFNYIQSGACPSAVQSTVQQPAFQSGVQPVIKGSPQYNAGLRQG